MVKKKKIMFKDTKKIYVIDENGRDKNESKRLWTVENKILMKRRGGSKRGLEGEWMVRGGRKGRKGESSVERRGERKPE